MLNMQVTSAYTRPFSYVDSACGFVYFNLCPENLGDLQDEVQSLLQLRDIDRENFIKHLSPIILEYLLKEYRSVFFHEWHHSLQNIFYPYRYLQTWRELSVGLNFLSALRRSSESFRLNRIDISPAWRDTITYSSMVHGINIEDGILVPVDRDLNDLRATDFTLTDLIEEATSIFQFKVEKGEEGSGASYRQWIRSSHSAYSSVFKLLSKLMGEENAYTALPPLVQASFSTTWPGTTFVSLVNTTLMTEGLDPQELGCDIYYTILCSQLKKPSSPLTMRLPDPDDPTEGDEYSFLGQSIYEQIIMSTPKHVLYPLALRYIELVAENPDFESFLFHPYRNDVITLLLEKFFPPLTVMRLHYDGLLKARDTLIVVSPYLKDMQVSAAPEVTYSEYFRETMRRKDIAYSLFTNINNYLEHNCHHRDCPYYTTNVCRRWSAIPKECSKCPFPKWFENVTGRSIDFQSGELKKISLA